MTAPATKTLQYYRDRSAECERIADQAEDPSNRELMLYLAERWRAMAVEGEAKEKPGKSKGPPLSPSE